MSAWWYWVFDPAGVGKSGQSKKRTVTCNIATLLECVVLCVLS